MDAQDALSLLREQISKVQDLTQEDPFGPKYKIWNDTTRKILKEAFDPEWLSMFESAGPNYVPVSREALSRKYRATLEEKRGLIEGFIHEHERFLGSGNSVLSGVKPLQGYKIHPEIAKVSYNLLEDGHLAQSVEEAFKRVINEVKALMIRRGLDTYDGGDSLMNHAFGTDSPPIRFNNLKTTEEKDEQKGLMFLFKGVVAIRNRKAHENVLLNDSNRAIEYLGLASLLMRLLELSQ